MNELVFTDQRVFRNTPGVRFSDITVPECNGIDLVEHSGPSVSPPDKDGRPSWYIHLHQTDNNRVIHGQRLFELFYPKWERPHWFVFLDEDTGALQIPPGCFHRSYSGKQGSLLLNHAVRTALFDETKDFTVCRCPSALDHPPHYHGISPWGVTTFINHGVYE